MSNHKLLLDRYNTPKSKYTGRPVSYNDIDATSKWIKYSLDHYELKKLLTKSSFSERFEILKALKTVESKLDFMYKHKNFDLKEATSEYKRAKFLLKM